MAVLKRILPFSKELLQAVIKPGDSVIDATVGNGHDTLFLAECVGSAGHVYGFDIQEIALQETQAKLEAANVQQVSLILDGHQNVLTHVQTKVKAAVFNLGYLPGSDGQITTRGETTWKAIGDILSILESNGLIILIIYHGHEEGKVERDYLLSHIKTLDSYQTQVLQYQFVNRKDAPFILAIEKLQERKRCIQTKL